ncbi:LexA family transcriptional regulator [Zooshikella marina]|uniref:LexA family transcriptional regulator n=1 Tax=Zooshikella ganghwensis TaxID=202772 RepID=UPI001BAFA161|nr:LexA family transcriptional regulator [Zooshikella ganghwensis]MBU2708780.1 LexA family transcriptional regulator [Zooshikella ganghwensis]
MINLDIDQALIDEYWVGVGERLKQAREAYGFKKRIDAANFLGITVARLANYEYGSRQLNYFQVLEFAKVYNVSPAWLAGYEKDATGLKHLTNEITEIPSDFAITHSWLEKHNYDKNNVSIIEVPDNSMNPTLPEGETVLVNKAVNAITDKDLYAFKVHDKLLFRWIQKTGDDSFTVEAEQSDMLFPDQTINSEQFSQLQIIGRVEMVFRKR